MRRLLLDANQSPRTAAFLRQTFGFDVEDLTTLGLFALPDEDVVAYAKLNRRVIVTEDLDFGRLYTHYNRGQIGIIVMRLGNQSIAAVISLLGRFFADTSTTTIDLHRSLVLLDDERVGIRGTIFPVE